jgi:threonine aldolase
MKNSFPHSFGSDNFSGIHPEIMKAIQEANTGHTIAYGDDPWTKKMEDVFQKFFGASAEAFIVFNGTAANICGIRQVILSWQAVMSPQTAHIATDECGAIEANVGSSILKVETKEGKLDPNQLKAFLDFRGFQHHVQPTAISVSQSTELGTVYTLEELRKIAKFAQENDLLFHMDGARLSNAAASLKVSLKEISTDVGVDVLSFGGTKNGLMGAEAVVFLKPGLAKNFQYVRKQHLQLASKMRFLSAQMVALLEGDLWKRNATHANAMAKLLEDNIRQHLPDLKIIYPVQSNAVFVQLPKKLLIKLREKHFFWIWDEEKSIARWMTSWDTDSKFIEAFIADIKDFRG